MISVHKQISDLLKTVNNNVLRAYPEGQTTLPLIVYSEITNTHFSKWVDEVEFQVDVYAATFAQMEDLAIEADEAMQGIGFNRTYASPDTQARQETDLYKKALNYRATIDTYHNNILQE